MCGREILLRFAWPYYLTVKTSVLLNVCVRDILLYFTWPSYPTGKTSGMTLRVDGALDTVCLYPIIESITRLTVEERRAQGLNWWSHWVSLIVLKYLGLLSRPIFYEWSVENSLSVLTESCYYNIIITLSAFSMQPVLKGSIYESYFCFRVNWRLRKCSVWMRYWYVIIY